MDSLANAFANVFSSDILIAVMFLGQHEKEVLVMRNIASHSIKNISDLSGDLGKSGAKDQECFGRGQQRSSCKKQLYSFRYLDLVAPRPD